jgi:hypothetical protein
MQILIKPNEDGRIHNFAGKNANIDKAFRQSLTAVYECGDGTAYSFDTDKFAELIAGECAKLCYDQVKFFTGSKDRVFQCLADGIQIKKHFGVTE